MNWTINLYYLNCVGLYCIDTTPHENLLLVDLAQLQLPGYTKPVVGTERTCFPFHVRVHPRTGFDHTTKERVPHNCNSPIPKTKMQKNSFPATKRDTREDAGPRGAPPLASPAASSSASESPLSQAPVPGQTAVLKTPDGKGPSGRAQQGRDKASSNGVLRLTVVPSSSSSAAAAWPQPGHHVDHVEIEDQGGGALVRDFTANTPFTSPTGAEHGGGSFPGAAAASSPPVAPSSTTGSQAPVHSGGPVSRSKKRAKMSPQPDEDLLEPRFSPGDLVKLTNHRDHPEEGTIYTVGACVHDIVLVKKSPGGQWRLVPAEQLFKVGSNSHCPPDELATSWLMVLRSVLGGGEPLPSHKQNLLKPVLQLMAKLHIKKPNLARIAQAALEEWEKQPWSTKTAPAKVRAKFATLFDSFCQDDDETNSDDDETESLAPAKLEFDDLYDAPQPEPANEDDALFDDSLEHPVARNDQPLEVNLNIPNLDAYPDAVKATYRTLERNDQIKVCKFDIMKLLNRADQHMVNYLSNQSGDAFRRMILGGKTQSGKAVSKATLSIQAHHRGFTTVIVTTSQINCTELVTKINNSVFNKDKTLPFAFTIHGGLDKEGKTLKGQQKRAEKEIQKAFSLSNGAEGGIIVLNYGAAAQLVKVHKELCAMGSQRRPLLLILDEADEMFKHDFDQNLQEKSLEKLRCLAGLTIMITATPLPLFIEMLDVTQEGHVPMEGGDVQVLITGDDYVSTNDLQALKDETTGEPLFIEPGELTFENCFIDGEEGKVRTMYWDALQDQTKRSLLIDITDARVMADGGIFDKGGKIGQMFAEHEAVFIAAIGSGIWCRSVDPASPTRGYGNWKQLDKKVRNPRTEDQEPLTLDHAIRYVERVLKWNGPIVVLGYTAIFRGISIRSLTRVPSHLIVNLTNGLSMEKVVQAFGRGTGDFRRQLEANGFDCLKVLCQREDFDLVQRYPQMVQEFENVLSQPNQNLKSALLHVLKQCGLIKNRRNIGNTKKRYAAKALKQWPHLLPIPDSINVEECTQALIRRYIREYKVELASGQDPFVRFAEEREFRKARMEAIEAAQGVPYETEEESDNNEEDA